MGDLQGNWMSRYAELKRLDKKTRNKLRAILSFSDGNAIPGLADLRGKPGKDKSEALDLILNSPARLRAVRTSTPFPQKPAVRRHPAACALDA